MMHGQEKSDSPMSSDEAYEQTCNRRGGVGTAKGGDQGNRHKKTCIGGLKNGIKSYFLPIRKEAIACRLPSVGHVGVKCVHLTPASPPLSLLVFVVQPDYRQSFSNLALHVTPVLLPEQAAPCQSSRRHICFSSKKIGGRTHTSVDFSFDGECRKVSRRCAVIRRGRRLLSP